VRPLRPLALTVVAGLGGLACSSGQHHASTPVSAAAPKSTLASLAPIPTAVAPPVTAIVTDRRAPTPAAPAAPTGVGTVLVDVVDPSRPTVQGGRRLSSSRHLPTVVRYPATGTPPGAEIAGARPATGRWPLVVFAHGYNVTPATYSHLLHTWAAAGFVVAAPSFPLETAGGPLDENDLSNEPQDIVVVITAVIARSEAITGPLAGRVRPGPVAVSGHSDGAEAALAAAYHAADSRIGPVISMAAQGILGGPRPDARYPLLVVQGTADTVNPPARGDAVYAMGGRPKWELHLLGGGHLPPIADPTPWRPIVEQVSIDFLRGGASTAALAHDAAHPGVTSLSADP
jgi:dienelactone hydrolase